MCCRVYVRGGGVVKEEAMTTSDEEEEGMSYGAGLA